MGSTIVVGTDGSDSAQVAVDEAVRLAGALDAELHVVSAYEPLQNAHVSGANAAAAREYGPMGDSKVESVLDQAAARVRLSNVPVVCHAVRQDAVDGLLDIASEVAADMIVVGSRGMHGARRLALGNVPNQVSHKARCNVLIVNTDGH